MRKPCNMYSRIQNISLTQGKRKEREEGKEKGVHKKNNSIHDTNLYVCMYVWDTHIYPIL